MRLIDRLKCEAVRRELVDPAAEIDAALAFSLVREMPYRRASDRRPETIIAEWRGTCSGKHYLLQSLFAELGLSSQVMACTVIVPIEPDKVPKEHVPQYEAAHRHFVDVHNYLVLQVPGGGQMVVDATWPLAAREAGMVSNPTFILGQDQQVAANAQQVWPIPAGRDPQEFKDELLKTYFSPAELEFREQVIQALAEKAVGQ